MELSTLTRTERTRHYIRDVGRIIKCLGKPGGVAANYRTHYPRSLSLESIEQAERARTKATVPGGSNLPASWAYPLLPTAIGHAFAEFIQPFTIIGRMSDLVRRVNFLTKVSRSTAAFAGYWANAGRPKALTSGAFDNDSLPPATAAGIIVLANEVLDYGATGTEDFIASEARAGVAAFLDEQFVDPSNTGVTDVAPASITAGVSASGSSTGEPVEDFRTLLQAYRNQGGSMASCVLLLGSEDAAALALRSGANGTPMFPGLDVTGGRLAGLPALASDAISGQIIAVDAKGILLADQLGFDIALSREATVEMSDTPTNNSATPTATAQVSLYQTNSTGIRCERHINWQRSGAIAIVDGVDYLREGGSPN